MPAIPDLAAKDRATGGRHSTGHAQASEYLHGVGRHPDPGTDLAQLRRGLVYVRFEAAGAAQAQ